MRRSRDVISVVVLLLIFVVGGLLLSRPDTGESRLVGAKNPPDPSVYSDRATGSKGVYDWVSALGYTPTIWREDWGHLSQSQAPVMLIIDPSVEESFSSLTGHTDDSQDASDILDASDAQRLRQWLQSGHMAVLMSSRIPSGHTPGETSDDDKDTFGDAMDLIVETATGGGRNEYAPLEPVPATENVISIHTDADVRIRRRAADGIALFGDGSGPVALDIPIGAGRLVVIADSTFASNANLAQSENAVFLANLLKSEAHHGDRVLFDEFHHGDVELETGETVWSALGHPLQLTLVQLFLAFVVIIGVVAVRFGAPLPLMQGTHRSSAEYVASLASLYQRAQASPAALDVLYRQFLRDLAGRLALSPDVSLEILADTAARRGQVDKQALRQLLAACENHLDTGKLTDGELLDLARRMSQIRKEIGIA